MIPVRGTLDNDGSRSRKVHGTLIPPPPPSYAAIVNPLIHFIVRVHLCSNHRFCFTSECVAVLLSQLAVLLSPLVACGASQAASDGQDVGAEKKNMVL